MGFAASKAFGKSGSVEMSGTFGINESAGDLASMSSKTDMIMTYAGGSVDSMTAKFLPHVSGSGFDAHGSYSLSGSTIVSGTSGKANLAMTKTYTDGSSMELAGEVPFPIGSSFSTEFDYTLSGGAKASTFGFSGSSGSVAAMATKAGAGGAGGALVDGESYSFSGSGGSFTGTLHPKFEGSGTDSKGDFKLSHMNSNIMNGGSKLELVGKKT